VNIERLLFFIFNNNVLIIEILFAVSLCGILLLAFRFFTGKEEALGVSPDWNRLEDNIKKILENASLAPGVKSSEVSVRVPMEIPEGMSESVFIHELQTQLERAQIQLIQKEEEIKKLNESVASIAGLPVAAAVTVPASSASSEVAAFEEKIKDLESRLNEYSIIEDDIADLSFYKEETVRLQSEVDRLTAELAALKEAEASAPAVTAKAPPAQVAEVASPIAEVIPAVVEQPVAEPAPAEVVAPATGADFIDNDIMAEFERAVAEQKAATEASKNSKAEAKAEKLAAAKKEQEMEVAPIAAVEPEPPVVALVPESVAVEPESSSAMPEGDINIDKMLDEAQDLTASEVAEVPNAIDSTLDTDKLLKEATGMGNLDSEALSEFSDFVKKEGA
jgi:hypothetical protein